jgi:hypothetical protein
MTERIRVEVDGSARGLQRAAAQSVASIGTISAAARRADVQTNRSARANTVLAGSIGKVNRNATLLRNTIAAIRWPALITGAGLAAQALSGAAGGATALVGALGPLTGLVATLPGLFATAAQGISAFALATGGISDAIKASMAAQEQASSAAGKSLDAQAAATDRVRTATQGLAAAERQAKIDEENLTRARKDGRRELEDMRQAAERGAATEARARLSVQDAENELARLRREGAGSGEVAEARLRVQEARDELEATRTQVRRERADYADAKKRGVNGMDQVVAARRQRADAERAVTEAVRELTRAQREATTAANDQSAAVAKVNTEFDKLPDSGKRFARFLISLKPRLDDLREIAADGPLPGSERGIRAALKNFAPLRRVIGLTAGEMGDLAEQTGELVGSKAFGRDLEIVGRRNAQTLDHLGDAGLRWTDVLRDIMVEAGPLQVWLAKTTGRLSGLAAEEVHAARESGALRAFFRETRETLQVAGPMVWDFARGLGHIARLGKPLGDEILVSLRDSAREFRGWTESAQGENAIRRYFADAKPMIFETGRLVRDLTHSFFRLGTEEGAVDMLRSIRTEVLPAIESLVSGMTRAFGPHMVDLVVSLAKTMEVLVGPTGALTLLVDLARMASDALRAVLSVPGLGGFAANMITAFGVFKGLKWAGMIGAAQKLNTLWRGIAVSATATGVATGVGGGLGRGRGPQAPAGGVATVAGGAAAGGLAGRLAPLAKRVGLVGIGVSLLSGASSAFGDKSRQADFGGKVSNFLAGAIGVGAVDYAAKGRRIRDEILKGVEEEEEPRRVPLAPRSTATREVDPEAGLNDQTKGQLDRLRQIRGRAQEIFGKRVVLRVGVSAGDLDRIESNFSRLKQGSDISLRQLRETANGNFKLIAQNLDVHSKAGQEAVSRNFRLAIRNVKRLLDDGVISSGQAGREISRLMRTHSGTGTEELKRNYADARDFIAKTMRNAQGITAEGMAAIRKIYAQELKLYGLSDKEVQFRLRGKEFSGKSSPGGTTHTNAQRGGPIFGGDPTGDSVPAMLERGEYVLNRKAVKKVGRQTLDQINYGMAARFQEGGWVGDSPTGLNPAIKSIALWAMRKYGATASDTTRPPGTRTSTGGISNHSIGAAVDLVAPDMLSMARGLDRAFRPRLNELIYTPLGYSIKHGAKTGVLAAADHYSHVHAAALGRAVAAMARKKLGRITVDGDGALPGIVQAALDNVRTAGQHQLDSVFDAMGGGDLGGSMGAFKGGGDAAANRRLARQMAAARGWTGAEWRALDYLWGTGESGFRTDADNPTSSAYGIPQRLLDAHPLAPGDDYMTNPATQIDWGLDYISGRYGTPSQALAFWQSQNPHWYAAGGLVDRLAYVGDSLGVGTLGPLRSRLPKVAINGDVKGGRGSPAGADVLAQLLGRQHDAAVFDLGTNDPDAGVLRSSVARARGLLDGRPLVMATVNGPDAKRKNAMLRSLAGLELVDWAARSQGLTTDGIHGGYSQRAGMFAAAIRALRVGDGPANVPLGHGIPSDREIRRQTGAVKKARKRAAGDPDNKRLQRALRESRERLKALKARRKAGLQRRTQGQQRLDNRLEGFELEGSFVQQIDGLRRDIEDKDALYGITEGAARSDDVLTPSELDDLVGRQTELRNMVGGADGLGGGMVALLKDVVLPRIKAKVDELREFMARLRKRVAENARKLKEAQARAKRLRDQIEKVDKAKKPTKAQTQNREKWRRELTMITQRDIPALEADNMFVLGTAGGNGGPREGSLLHGAGGPDGVLESLRAQQAGYLDDLRPGNLPTEWSTHNLAVIALLREGATKPVGGDGGTIADVMREQRDQARRALAISDARFDVFRGFAPLLGRYSHGTKHVPRTGIYMLEEGEAVAPAAKGPYPAVNRAGAAAAPVQVAVHVHGDAGPLLKKIEVTVDGKLQRQQQDIQRRGRTLARGPGR